MVDSTNIIESLVPAATPCLNLKRGSMLGKYRLEKRLGVGQICEVYKARDTIEGIWVALKIPLVGIDGRRDNKTLLKEIRLIAQLRHPHILPVKNAEIINGHAVLATELSVGTLADRSKPMAPSRIISIITQVLAGLAHAHRNRMLHCDVTPGNIFLFRDKRAALGDFSISLKLRGRMKTIDDFGTPGYVAPEQAYGRPTYRSDCFSIALILYEYITGSLPRWPFDLPPRGYDRLRIKTSLTFAKFLQKSLSVNPEKRFANAGKMLTALTEATPKSLHSTLTPKLDRQKNNWQQLRRQAFITKYKKIFPVLVKCIDCAQPIAEEMKICPSCASSRNRFDSASRFTHICPRCHKGVLPEWRFCPWCYGPGFDSPSPVRSKGFRYHTKCAYCRGRLMRFMRYCPSCRRKVRRSWLVPSFSEICNKCHWPVDSNFWNYCPWCTQRLLQ